MVEQDRFTEAEFSVEAALRGIEALREGRGDLSVVLQNLGRAQLELQGRGPHSLTVYELATLRG